MRESEKIDGERNEQKSVTGSEGSVGLPVGLIRHAWNKMTVEPLILINNFVYASSEAIQETLYVDKSCLVTLQKPAEICANLSNYKADRIEVQKYSSRLLGISTLVENLIPVVLLFYLGPLSDRYGRKKFLAWFSLMGTLKYGTLLLSSIFMYLPAELALLGPFFGSLGTSRAGMQMMLFVCVSDVTTSANRTFRLGILKIIMSIGIPLGTLYGGMMFSAFGYIAVFGTATFMSFSEVLYALSMKETLPLEKRKNEMTRGLSLRDVYRIPKELIVAILGKDRSQRIVLISSLFNFFVASICMQPPEYLFSRLMFNWNATQFSYWKTLQCLANSAALMILLPILLNRFKLRDAAIGMTGGGSAAFMYILMGQIRNVDMIWIMIVAPIVGSWRPAVYVTLRSIISKTASGSQELGKVFAAQAISEVAGQVVAGPLFSAFYNATLHSLPGATFLLCASLFTLIVFGIRFCEVYIQRWEMKSTQQRKLYT